MRDLPIVITVERIGEIENGRPCGTTLRHHISRQLICWNLPVRGRGANFTEESWGFFGNWFGIEQRTSSLDSIRAGWCLTFADLCLECSLGLKNFQTQCLFIRQIREVFRREHFCLDVASRIFWIKLHCPSPNRG